MDSVFRFLSFSFLLAWVCGAVSVFSVRRFHLVPDTYHTAWVVSFDTFCYDWMGQYLRAYGGGVSGSGGEVCPRVISCVCHRCVSDPVSDAGIQATKKLAKQEVYTMDWVGYTGGELSILLRQRTSWPG